MDLVSKEVEHNPETSHIGRKRRKERSQSFSSAIQTRPDLLGPISWKNMDRLPTRMVIALAKSGCLALMQHQKLSYVAQSGVNHEDDINNREEQLNVTQYMHKCWVPW